MNIEIFPDSGKRRPYIQWGGRIYIILHLSACKGVNTRGVNVDPNCVKLGWRYEVYAEVVFYVSSPLS